MVMWGFIRTHLALLIILYDQYLSMHLMLEIYCPLV